MFYLKSIVYLSLFPFYLIRFSLTGKNTKRSHMSMLYSFLLTNGHINDLIVRVKSILKPYHRYEGLETLIDLPPEEDVIKKLRTDGYAVVENCIDQGLIDRIVNKLASKSAMTRQLDAGNSRIIWECFDKDNVKAVRYDFNTEDVLSIEEVQELLSSPFLMNVAGNYLGTAPAADIVGAWWNAKFGEGPDSNAAQFFHFDLDRLKWLKVFIYLTDVEKKNGPHEFVRGTHKSGILPKKIRQKIYSRLSDSEVNADFGTENRIVMTGRKGTIIFEDTRGLHKGNAVEDDPRLILQFQYSASLFGAVYPRSELKEIKSIKLQKVLNSSHKGVYREYI